MSYHTLALLITNTCNSNCPHCIAKSSPSAKGTMDILHIEQIIKSSFSHVNGISITGGEPLIFPDLCLKTIRLIKANKLRAYLVTNGFWGKDDRTADKIINALSDAGLNKLYISFDMFHDDPIELSTIESIIKKVLKTKVKFRIKHCGNTEDDQYKEIKKLAMKYRFKVRTQPLLPVGRGTNLYDMNKHITFDEIQNGPCNNAYEPLVTPAGDLYTCCGPALDCQKFSPLLLGNINCITVTEGLQKGSQDIFLQALSSIGPKKLIGMLSPTSRKIVEDKLFDCSRCLACRTLTDDNEIVKELMQKIKLPQYL